MLKPQKLPAENIQLSTPRDGNKKAISDNDPGVILMTDLRRTTPYQILSESLLNDVDAKMKACEVRLLFVHDTQENFIGVVTLTDLAGEKPLLYATQHNTPIVEVTARDIMTPVDKLDAVPLDQVMNSKVAEIVAAQKMCHRKHMLVFDDSDNKNRVCGIISITRTGKLLNIDIEPNQKAESFAELNQALSS